MRHVLKRLRASFFGFSDERVGLANEFGVATDLELGLKPVLDSG